MRLRVAEQILTAWHEQVEQEVGETAVLMRLTSPAGVAPTQRALDEAVRRVVAARTDDDPFCGDWSWVASGDDVLVTVLDCRALPDVLPEFVAALEGEGIGGSLELYEEPELPSLWPASTPLVEARLRLRGERDHVGGQTYHWHAHEDALARAIEIAVNWCVPRPAPSARLRVDANPLVDAPAAGLVARVREEVAQATTAVEVRRPGRGVTVEPFWGRITLIDFRPWQQALPAITGALREAAEVLAYAYVKSGWDAGYAVFAQSLEYDWPPRSELGEEGVESAVALEDEYAPDAFGVQLLGPGYGARVPSSRLYRPESVADCTLLEHVDLPAWFDVPFVPAETHWTKVRELPAPPVLAEARAELAPVLLTQAGPGGMPPGPA